ncbi:unnamed protein product [Gongylonema pulchrum]|uniref:Ovule protein n=1 Tax=Gongylonema pulchrum TaxID=637853 RepID=A0A183DEJ9_9BILA|nr:unnamed protein product [Gongylonema pulchrum]
MSCCTKLLQNSTDALLLCLGAIYFYWFRFQDAYLIHGVITDELIEVCGVKVEELFIILNPECLEGLADFLILF